MKAVPGSQLILTPPGEFPEALVALVVVVEHAAKRRSTQIHQSVVGRLLLLPTGVTVEQVVDLIRYFWKGKHTDNSESITAAANDGWFLLLKG